MEQITSMGGTITLIHFMYEMEHGWRIACMPNMVEFHQTPYHTNYQRTNEVRATKCPACEKTQVFKDAKQALETALGGSVRVA